MELNTILNCYTEGNNEHGYLILFLFWWFEILNKQHIKQHGAKKPTIADIFLVLKKYRNKLDYLVYEMFFYKRSQTIIERAIKLDSRELLH